MPRATTKKPAEYKTLLSELEDVRLRLEEGELDIDEAVTCFGRGIELVTQLENILKNAENTVTVLKSSRSEAV